MRWKAMFVLAAFLLIAADGPPKDPQAAYEPRSRARAGQSGDMATMAEANTGRPWCKA